MPLKKVWEGIHNGYFLGNLSLVFHFGFYLVKGKNA